MRDVMETVGDPRFLYFKGSNQPRGVSGVSPQMRQKATSTQNSLQWGAEKKR